MKTITIRNIEGEVLFEHSCKNNTIRKTVEKAVRKNISLKMADLEGADLKRADLMGADLMGADLYEANLYEANLYEANLRWSCLRKADLRWSCLRKADLYKAKLIGVDLTEADLRNTNTEGTDLENSNLEATNINIFCKWDVGMKGNILKIGCESKTFKEWEEWFKSDDKLNTNRGTEDFKRIEAMFKAYKSYYDHINLP